MCVQKTQRTKCTWTAKWDVNGRRTATKAHKVPEEVGQSALQHVSKDGCEPCVSCLVSHCACTCRACVSETLE